MISRHASSLWVILFLIASPALQAEGAARDERGRFVNRYADLSHSQNFLSWQWTRLTEGLPKPPKQPTPQMPVDETRLLRPQGTAQVTWIGHSSLLYQTDGKNLLFDPVYAEYASPVPPLGPKRAQPPGIPFEALPHIDAVFISHNHYDHLDLETVRRLMQQAGGSPTFYVPLGVDAWFVDNVPGSRTYGDAPNVIAMDWDETQRMAGGTHPMTIRFLAVQHWAARSPFDRNKTLWGSWVIEQPKFRFWFAGDLAYSPDIDDIARAHGGFDLAAIPIGVYEPRWFMKRAHIDPDEALLTFKKVGARKALGIHWGTFDGLSDESLDEPPVAFNRARQEAKISADDFMLFRIGETRSFNSASTIQSRK
jgi:L-ascorbate metabolism protein UlaG (beta-lactamase superfamily)